MRLEYARFHELGPFADFELDLRPYADAKTIAIVGPNGVGKTAALEMALAGASYREMPTHGKLQKRARARDSTLEVGVVNGQSWVIRHSVDAVSGKGESVVLDASGKPAFDGTGAKAFRTWASKHLPAAEMLYATQFAVQGSRGFLGLGSADRISLILQAIGVERIERMAEGARRQASFARGQLAAILGRVADARAGAPDLATAELEHSESVRLVALAEQALLAARADHLAAEALVKQIAALRAEADAAKLRRVELEAAVARALLRQVDLTNRATQAGALVESADQIRAAAARVEELRRFIGEEERRADGLRAEAEAARVRREELGLEAAEALKRAVDIEERIANNRLILTQAEQIRAASLRAEEWRTRLAAIAVELGTCSAESAEILARRVVERAAAGAASERAQRATMRLSDAEAVGRKAQEVEPRRAERATWLAAIEKTDAETSELREKHVAGEAERRAYLRFGLVQITTEATLDAAVGTARGALDRDDQLEEQTRVGPARLKELEASLARDRQSLVVTEGRLAEAERAAGRLGEFEALRVEQAAAEADRAAAEERLSSLSGREAALAQRSRELSAEADGVGAELATVKLLADRAGPLAQAETRLEVYEPQARAARAEHQEASAALAEIPEPLPSPPDLVSPARLELSGLEPMAGKLEALAQAEGAIAALTPELGTARALLADAQAALAAAPDPPVVPDPPDDSAAREVERAETALRGAGASVARADERLALARAAAERVEELDVDRLRLEAELSDWARLALDLGRDGIQSSEVDSAGPEITEIANDLLRTCHGPRFTLAIDTTRLSANGTDVIDECRVNVIDSVAGREGEAREFSGGEMVILGECMSLALTTLACQRAGTTGCTLVRDESGAALDPENSRAYMKMLRRSVDMIGARQALVVSHSVEVQELCDARIEIGPQSFGKLERFGAEPDPGGARGSEIQHQTGPSGIAGHAAAE